MRNRCEEEDAQGMPVKLIKKSWRQQYVFSTKDVFVITVELLDNAVLECTLSSESTGR